MKRIEYSVRTHARSRRMKLTIYPDGRVVATVPKKYSALALERFVASHTIWISEKLAYFQRRKASAIVLQQGSYEAHKQEAYNVACARMEYFNKLYGFVWKKITIRNQRVRWGSCSLSGNISLSYKIIFLPDELRDYVIVHELCHLGEFNHSKAFWDLVARAFPSHLKLRRKMRRVIR